jgi:hypothetical protein
MDSHFDQVNAARARAAGSAERLYFGYSTILDRIAFDEWRAQHGYGDFRLPEGEVAEALDVALVFDFPSRFWAGRVAGLKDAPGSSVFGRLYRIAGGDWPIIEHKEGAVTGMCVARSVRVRANGKEHLAEAFTTRPERASTDGPVSSRFIEALVRGAKQSGLPAPWIQQLSDSER